MALGRGVVQWIRVRLDPNARRQARDEARQAGREVGDALADGTKAGSRRAGDTVEKEIKQGARAAERDVQQSTSRIGRLFSGLGTLFAGVFALGAVKAFISQMWELGTAASETQSKFNTTFGREGSAQVQAFLDQWGSLAGLNRTVGQEFTATAGAIVQGMGASQQASAQFSERILRLAGDLQSFHNVPIEETFQAIRSGVTGEFESLKRFGIVLRQSEIDLRAMADTGKNSAKDLTQLERAQASLTLMIEKAGPALGDLNRTKDSTANKARNLKAEYENLKIELATALLPVFANMVDWLDENKTELRNVASAAADVARVMGGALWSTLNSVSSLLAGAFASNLGQVVLLYRSMEYAILSVIAAKEKMRRVVGQGSNEEVAEASAAVDEARRGMGEARDAIWNGVKEMGRAFTEAPRHFMQVWNLGRGDPGPVTWEDPRPPIVQAPYVDPDAAKKAARDREAELTAQVQLLQEMAERRADFPELTERAATLERRLTAELESGNVTTKRRVTLLDQLDKLRAIVASTDPASLRAERERERIEKDRRQGLADEVQLLERANAVRDQVPDLLDRVKAAETKRWKELSDGNADLERQLELYAEIGRLAEIRNARPFGAAAIETTADPRFQEDVDAVLDYWSQAATLMQDLAGGFADAWGDAFDLVLSDAGNAADALAALGRGMGAALLGGLANYAMGKVQENLAGAIEALAKAAVAGSTPGMQWAVPGFLAGAKTHGLAAAAWGVLAGASGAGARAVSGSSAVGATSGGRTAGSVVDNASRMGAEVHIYMDPLDPRNPRVQDFVHAAMIPAVERHGADARVFWHPSQGAA